MLDQLRMLTWLQTKDGAKGKNRPKPLSPLNEKAKDSRARRWGHTDLPPAEAASLFHRVARGAWARPALGGGTVEVETVETE